MTQSLEQAIAAVEKLPAPEQDVIAALILDEIADERRWHATFAGSQDALAQIARNVRADIRTGRVTDMGIDES